MIKLKYIFEVVEPLDNLADYEAATPQEAADNQMAWFKDGTCDPADVFLGASGFTCHIEVIEELETPPQ